MLQRPEHNQDLLLKKWVRIPEFITFYQYALYLTRVHRATFYQTGHVPSKWKRANVCGVFKNGEKSDPSNSH